MSKDTVTVVIDGASVEVPGSVADWLRKLHEANAEERDALLKILQNVIAKSPVTQSQSRTSISYKDFVELAALSPERLGKLVDAGTPVRVIGSDLRDLATRISSIDLTDSKLERLRDALARLHAHGNVALSREFVESLSIRYEPEDSPTPSAVLPAGAALAGAVIAAFAAGFGIGLAAGKAALADGESIEIDASAGEGNVTIINN